MPRRHVPLRHGCLPLLACLVLATVFPARAAVQTYATAGAWRAFGGSTETDRLVCGIATTASGLWFGMKYFQNEQAVTVQASNPAWVIPERSRIRVTMRIDSRDPWHVVGRGFRMHDGDGAIEFRVSPREIGQWLTEFKQGRSLVLAFPDGGLPDARVDLAGSAEIALRFGECLRVMERARS